MLEETNMHGADLEQRIDYQALLLHTADTPEKRRAAWNELVRLHSLRSADRVEEMEKQQGLS